MHWLWPRLSRRDLRSVLCLAGIGGLLGGCYGILHDLITYSLGPEYFTRLKFQQFAWADPGLPPHLFAAEIGWLATAAAGAIAGWFLARRAVPGRAFKSAAGITLRGLGIVLAVAMTGGVVGFVMGRARMANADFSNWSGDLEQVGDPASFVLVAYIHNSGYAGALIGLLLACLVTGRPGRKHRDA